MAGHETNKCEYYTFNLLHRLSSGRLSSGKLAVALSKSRPSASSEQLKSGRTKSLQIPGRKSSSRNKGKDNVEVKVMPLYYVLYLRCMISCNAVWLVGEDIYVTFHCKQYQNTVLNAALRCWNVHIITLNHLFIHDCTLLSNKQLILKICL